MNFGLMIASDPAPILTLNQRDGANEFRPNHRQRRRDAPHVRDHVSVNELQPDDRLRPGR